MPTVTMKQLLESGVHFGHQTRRWNPKMKRYIFGERGGIYIIDLQQTIVLLEQACDVVRDIAAARRHGAVRRHQEAVARTPSRSTRARCGMPYVSHRWLGGLLTNWGTISQRIRRLHELRNQKREGQLELLPTRERLAREGELVKLETNLGGVADMQRLPDAVVIVDLRKEAIGVREANRLGLAVIGLVDTNCDPDEATYVIPGNDDAIRSCNLVLGALADAVLEGKGTAARRPASRRRTAPPPSEAADRRGPAPRRPPPPRPRPPRRPPRPRRRAVPRRPPRGRRARRAGEPAPAAEAPGRGPPPRPPTPSRRGAAEPAPEAEPAGAPPPARRAPREHHDPRQARQGAAREDRRRDDGLQAGARGGRRRHRGGATPPCAPRASPTPPSAPAAPRTRAWSTATSTRAAAWACWSR